MKERIFLAEKGIPLLVHDSGRRKREVFMRTEEGNKSGFSIPPVRGNGANGGRKKIASRSLGCLRIAEKRKN